MSKSLSAEPSSNRIPALIAAGIFVFAFALRLLGIGWGLADDLHHQSLHPDEYLIWTKSQAIKPGEGKFDPGFYNYGTLYLTVLRVASDMTGAYTKMPDKGDEEGYWAYVGRCNLAGRIISSLAGAGTAAVIFFILLRFANRWGAVFGALLPAVAPGFVVHSRFQTVDVLATFFLALSTLYAIRLLYPPEGVEKVDWRSAILAGVFAGASTGTKYTGILVLLSLYAALLVSKRPQALKLALAGTGAALATFVITTPGVVLNTGKFMQDFAYEMAHTSSGHGLLFEGTSSAVLYHFANLQTGMGVLLCLASLVGLGYALLRGTMATYRTTYQGATGSFVGKLVQSKLAAIKQMGRDNPWVWVLLAFWVPYYLLIGRAEVKFLRYTFPLYVALAIGLGYAVSEARKRGGWGHAFVALALLGLGGFDYGGLRKTLTLSMDMAGRDARESSVDYLRKLQEKEPNLTLGLANDPWYYSPQTFPDMGVFRAAPFLQNMSLALPQMSKPRTLWYIPAELASNPKWTQEDLEKRPRWDPRLLTEMKPDYVALSNFEVVDIERLSGRKDISESAQSEVSQASAFQKELAKLYVPFKQFGIPGDTVNDMMYTQPVIYLWKRKDLP